MSSHLGAFCSFSTFLLYTSISLLYSVSNVSCISLIRAMEGTLDGDKDNDYEDLM